MKCPRDGTILQPVNVLDVALDKCHKCDGIWCDHGEMERLRDAKLRDIEEVIERKYGNPDVVEDETDGYMQCPRCDGRLQRFNSSFTAPVYLDRCEKCFGIWLDDGELNKLAGVKKEIDEEYTEKNLVTFLVSLSKKRGSW